MNNPSNSQFIVPQVTTGQEKEILFKHVIAYCCTGISFAKSKGINPKEYGEFMGNAFKPFRNPDDGFPSFGNGLMFMLAGIYPEKEMQILKQDDRIEL